MTPRYRVAAIVLICCAVGFRAGAYEPEQATIATEIVRTYYVFKGESADGARVAGGVGAALQLLDRGYTRRDLETALVRLFRESPPTGDGTFEEVFVAWMAAAAPTGDGTADVEPVPEPAEEPPPAPEPTIEPPPATEPADEPLPAPQPPPQKPAAAAEPVEADEPEASPQPASVDVRSGPPGGGVSRKQRAGFYVAGIGLLATGMIGGAISAGVYADINGLSPSFTPALGLIPVAGPAIAYHYWASYGERAYVLPDHRPVSVLLTVAGAVGTTLIIVGAALPKQRSSASRGLRGAVVVPSLAPGEASLTFCARF